MKKASTWLQRKHTWTWYADLVDKCSNPDCSGMSSLEVHHIVPLFQGGDDTISNCIVLCSDCHMKLGVDLHNDWEDYYVVLKNWKIKMDNDILDKMPIYHKNKIINENHILNDKSEFPIIAMNNVDSIKEKIYNTMMINRNTIKSEDRDRARYNFAYLCDHFDIDNEL